MQVKFWTFLSIYLGINFGEFIFCLCKIDTLGSFNNYVGVSEKFTVANVTKVICSWPLDLIFHKWYNFVKLWIFYFDQAYSAFLILQNRLAGAHQQFWSWPLGLGVVHKLRWQDFDHLPPCVDIFYGMNVDKKWTFLDHLPTYLVL